MLKPVLQFLHNFLDSWKILLFFYYILDYLRFSFSFFWLILLSWMLVLCGSPSPHNLPGYPIILTWRNLLKIFPLIQLKCGKSGICRLIERSLINNWISSYLVIKNVQEEYYTLPLSLSLLGKKHPRMNSLSSYWMRTGRKKYGIVFLNVTWTYLLVFLGMGSDWCLLCTFISSQCKSCQNFC